MDRGFVRREIAIGTMDDLLEAREYLRDLARSVGCGLVREAKLVAGLSDLAECFYLNGHAGLLILAWDGETIEAVLEHVPAASVVGLWDGPTCSDGRIELEPQENTASDLVCSALVGVRFMWDDVRVESVESPTKVVLRAWPKD